MKTFKLHQYNFEIRRLLSWLISKQFEVNYRNKKSLWQKIIFIIYLGPLNACNDGTQHSSPTESEFIPTFGAPTNDDESMAKFGFPWPSGNPFPSRQFNGPECGVKKFKKKRNLSCGIQSYIEERSPECGVEAYRREESYECPDSRKNSYQTFSDLKNFDAKANIGSVVNTGWLVCPAGSFIEKESDSRVIYKSTNPDNTLSLYEHRITCLTPGTKKTCELPIFGVELYKSCAHESHGAIFNECEDERFGVEEFNTCTIRSTVAELENYLKYLEVQIPLWVEQSLSAQSKYFSKLEGSQGLACLIKKNESDPLVESIILELKTLFQNTYLVEYKGSVHCADNLDLAKVIDAECSDREQGFEICSAQRTYRLQKVAFRNHIEVLEELKQQPFLKKDAALYQKIAESIDNLKVGQAR